MFQNERKKSEMTTVLLCEELLEGKKRGKAGGRGRKTLIKTSLGVSSFSINNRQSKRQQERKTKLYLHDVRGINKNYISFFFPHSPFKPPLPFHDSVAAFFVRKNNFSFISSSVQHFSISSLQ